MGASIWQMLKSKFIFSLVCISFCFAIESVAEEGLFSFLDYSEAIVLREVPFREHPRHERKVNEWTGGKATIEAFEAWIAAHDLRIDKKRNLLGHLHTVWPMYYIAIYKDGKVVQKWMITIPFDRDAPPEKGGVSRSALKKLIELFPRTSKVTRLVNNEQE